jgi:hypothetical protein
MSNTCNPRNAMPDKLLRFFLKKTRQATCLSFLYAIHETEFPPGTDSLSLSLSLLLYAIHETRSPYSATGQSRKRDRILRLRPHNRGGYLRSAAGCFPKERRGTTLFQTAYFRMLLGPVPPFCNSGEGRFDWRAQGALSERHPGK